MQNKRAIPGFVAGTDRLYLRELTPADLNGLYELYDSWGNVPGVEPLSENRSEEYEKLCAYIQWMYGFYGLGLWAVCLKDNGRMIGRCGAWPSQIGSDWLLELGYMIHKAYCRQGYGLEAMTAVTAFIRTETDFTKAAARIHSENRASARLAKALGMILDREALEKDPLMYLYRLDIS